MYYNIVQVDINYNGHTVKNSPFKPRTWDPRLVVVKGIGPGKINKPYFFYSEWGYYLGSFLPCYF